MKVQVTNLNNNESSTFDVVMNKKERPSFIWNGVEHILVDRTYPAEYTHINADKPMSDKFKYRIELIEGSEREIHEIWNRIQNTPISKK